MNKSVFKRVFDTISKFADTLFEDTDIIHGYSNKGFIIFTLYTKERTVTIHFYKQVGNILHWTSHECISYSEFLTYLPKLIDTCTELHHPGYIKKLVDINKDF